MQHQGHLEATAAVHDLSGVLSISGEPFDRQLEYLRGHAAQSLQHHKGRLIRIYMHTHSHSEISDYIVIRTWNYVYTIASDYML